MSGINPNGGNYGNYNYSSTPSSSVNPPHPSQNNATSSNGRQAANPNSTQTRQYPSTQQYLAAYHGTYPTQPLQAQGLTATAPAPSPQEVINTTGVTPGPASFFARLSGDQAAQVHNLSPAPVAEEEEIVCHINEMTMHLSSYEENFKRNSSLLNDLEKERIETRIAETGMTLEELSDVHTDGNPPPPSRQILKTSEDGATKGLLSVEIAPAHENGPPAFWINYMVTAADSKGHGKSLLLSALNCSEKEKFGGKLHVLSMYDESDNFYKKFGFKGEHNPLVLDPEKSPEIYKKDGNNWTFR